MTKTVIAVIQARMDSTRLPGKVMKEVNGRSLISMILDRVRQAEAVSDVWLATSNDQSDDVLAKHVEGQGYSVFRGDQEDVLSRFVAVAELANADIVVRICGDCPLIDPSLIDQVVGHYQSEKVDYACNTLERRYPDGLDVEVFSREALERTGREAGDPFLRAHVTPYMHGRLKDRLPWGEFSIASMAGDADFSHLRWTVDEQEDLDLIERLLVALPDDFTWQDVIALQTSRPEFLRINDNHVVYEGTNIDLKKYGHQDNRIVQCEESDRLFDAVKSIIPLASQTFSKSHQQWVKGASPLFMERAKGCRTWDVDGNSYIDYVLGLLPVILGYGDPDVDAAISDQLAKGIIFSLPSPAEYELAERLVRLIPCAEMVRFGKNGSDATTGAIRLARAHTKRDKVAVCGYHGWHDWYIGNTTRNLGVPQAVQDLTTGVPYNNADTLMDALSAEPDTYAAVILEPVSVAAPDPGYLEAIRDITAHHGTVLIFDEIITGFRMHMGGAQAAYGVTPDLACVGKSMANGMPISAVVGRREIMSLMEEVFVSGTFGGEALSIAAAIATIDKLEHLDGPAALAGHGRMLMAEANRILASHDLDGLLSFSGNDWWPRLTLNAPDMDGNLLNSLFRQEMIRHGLFVASSFNLCLAHTTDVATRDTLAAFDPAMARLAEILNSPDPALGLQGEPIQPTFSVR